MEDAQNLIAQLYVGYFNRAPDPEGLAYWVSRLEAGVSINEISKSFADSTEVKEIYEFFQGGDGVGISEIHAFLEAFYLNVFGRSIDADGLAHYTDQILEGGQQSALVVTRICRMPPTMKAPRTKFI